MNCPVCKNELYVNCEVEGRKVTICISCNWCDYEGLCIKLDLKGINLRKYKREPKTFNAVLDRIIEAEI